MRQQQALVVAVVLSFCVAGTALWMSMQPRSPASGGFAASVPERPMQVRDTMHGGSDQQPPEQRNTNTTDNSRQMHKLSEIHDMLQQLLEHREHAPTNQQQAPNEGKQGSQAVAAKEAQGGQGGSHQSPLLGSKYATSLGENFTVVYISRDADIDRQQQMEKGVAGLWNAERVPAVDGTHRENVLDRLAGTSQEAEASLQRLINNQHKPPKVHLKEAAVAISHLDAIRRVALSHRPYGLILEDDVTVDLLPFWTQTLEHFVQKMPPGWKMVRLAMSAKKGEWRKLFEQWHGELAFAPEKTTVYGAIAYLVPRAFAQNMLRMPFVQSNPADPLERIKVRLEKLPRYPCIVSDECILDRLAAGHLYAASPPLLNIPEGRLDQPDSTVRDHVKEIHLYSRLHSLDWAAYKFHECMAKVPEQRTERRLDCGQLTT